jgi:hypothetical protein
MEIGARTKRSSAARRVCGRMTRGQHQIIDGDRTAREFSSSPAEQRYLCAYCGRPLAVHEPVRWRNRLRRRWVR